MRCKLGIFSVAGVLSNIRITAPPNECQSRCNKARGKVCDSVWVTSGVKFNMRRRSVVLAGPRKSAKNRGVGGGALIQDSVLNRANVFGHYEHQWGNYTRTWETQQWTKNENIRTRIRTYLRLDNILSNYI